MSERSDPSRPDSHVGNAGQHRGFGFVRWIIVLLICIPSGWSIYQTRTQLAKLDAQLNDLRDKKEHLTTELVDVKQQKSEIDRAAQKAKLQQQQIEQIINQFREVDEFFVNESEMCVYSLTDRGEVNDTMRISIPAGKHFLHFQMTPSFPGNKDPRDKESRQRKFAIPLSGPAAYFIQIEMPTQDGAKHRDPREMFLHIASSNKDFKTIKRLLIEKPLPPPSGSSTGFFGERSLFFPNQHHLFNRDVSGVLLNQMKWSFNPSDEDRFDLQFELRLVSTGPEIIAAVDRGSVFKKKMKYIGKGRYQIIRDEEKPE